MEIKFDLLTDAKNVQKAMLEAQIRRVQEALSVAAKRAVVQR